MKNIYLISVLFVLFNIAHAQTIEPITNFHAAKTSIRKSRQTTKNIVNIQNKEMVTSINFAIEYEQKIENPKAHQVITITNKKYDGFVDIMGKKEPLKDVQNNMKPISILINQNGIVDSVIASEEMVNQLKQTVTGRMDKGKPNPCFFHVKSSQKIGDVWTDSAYYQDETNYYIAHYKLEKIENNVFSVSFTADVKMLNNYEQNQISFQTDVIGTASGTILVEPKTNYILKNEGSMKLEGRMIVNTQEIPTSIEGNFSDEFIK